jgi:hypothetical protein
MMDESQGEMTTVAAAAVVHIDDDESELPLPSSKPKMTIPVVKIKKKSNANESDGLFRDPTSTTNSMSVPATAAIVDETDDSVITGDWSVPSSNHPQQQQQQQHGATSSSNSSTNSSSKVRRYLSDADLKICRAIDEEYEKAIEERELLWNARYQSVRQSTVLSILFMVLLITTGTTFFLRQADAYWTIPEGLLFTIYSITTVGYGHLDMPDTPVFQLYTIFFIFLGIAMLTILVAQVYQCLSLEATRVVNNNNKPSRSSELRTWLEHKRTQRQRQQQQQAAQNQQHSQPHSTTNEQPMMIPQHHQEVDWHDVLELVLNVYDKTKSFLRDNEFGRGLSVVLPFGILISVGAIVVGWLEHWTAVEAIYFAVVSLTTVGYGDYYPTRTASVIFCCIWLPFSVGFMSLYLANVAAFYIRLSDRNVARIERVLRDHLQTRKRRAAQERQAVLQRALRGQQPPPSHLEKPSTTKATAQNEKINNAHATAITSERSGLDIPDTVVVESRSNMNPEQIRSTVPPHRRIVKGKRGIGFSGSNAEFTALPDHSNNTPNENDDDENDSNYYSTAVDPLAAPHPFASSSSRGSDGLFGANGTHLSRRRERIQKNSRKHMEFLKAEAATAAEKSKPATHALWTMKDVLRTVHRNNRVSDIIHLSKHGPNESLSMLFRDQSRRHPEEAAFLSIRSHRRNRGDVAQRQPSFALRALVQERLAEIIATDVAGYQNSIEIKEFTLSLTMNVLKEVSDKWYIPRRARRAFRSVAFETILFVGEHGLITRGADALYDLTPFEFHQLFAPLLAALGDAETMELWLIQTQALADVDLPGSYIHSENGDRWFHHEGKEDSYNDDHDYHHDPHYEQDYEAYDGDCKKPAAKSVPLSPRGGSQQGELEMGSMVLRSPPRSPQARESVPLSCPSSPPSQNEFLPEFS